MAKWRLTDGNDLYESVDLVLLPAGFRTVTVQSSVVQNDGLLITYFDRERLTTAIVGISGTLSSSENNVLLPYVFFLLPDDKVRDVQVMFQVWCVQLCPSQFVIYVPQGKVSHALNACWRASVGAHHTAASKVCIHILLQIKKLVYVKKKGKKTMILTRPANQRHCCTRRVLFMELLLCCQASKALLPSLWNDYVHVSPSNRTGKKSFKSLLNAKIFMFHIAQPSEKWNDKSPRHNFWYFFPRSFKCGLKIKSYFKI